jgi:hypothetical protein
MGVATRTKARVQPAKARQRLAGRAALLAEVSGSRPLMAFAGDRVPRWAILPESVDRVVQRARCRHSNGVLLLAARQLDGAGSGNRPGGRHRRSPADVALLAAAQRRTGTQARLAIARMRLVGLSAETPVTVRSYRWHVLHTFRVSRGTPPWTGSPHPSSRR